MLNKVSSSAEQLRQLAQTRWRDFRSEVSESKPWFKYGLIAFAVYLACTLLIGFYWSFEPARFDIRAATNAELEAIVAKTGAGSADDERHSVVTGAATTASLITVMDTLLHKRGWYISNDMMPPGVWLDNIPNWEYGVLIQSRDMAKAMREAFSRSQSQSSEDRDLALAESRFNFDHASWFLPNTESEYREGIGYLRSYFKRLNDENTQDAQFYARADNLRYWLKTVETRLGSLSQRLSASVGQRRLNIDLAGEQNAKQSTPSRSELEVKTPWLEIDDEFYIARGSAWAIIHFLRAVELDFAPVLENKNAKVSLQQIIRELEATQQAVFSPIILNGSGFGTLANHSLVMASYISRANAALIDLRELLTRG